MIAIKRAYDPAAKDDGFRVLVDRLWPRGRSKAQLRLDAWMKDVAPSTALRTWFGHDPKRWTEFKRRYKHELGAAALRPALQDLARRGRRGRLTLVYGAKDEQHNQAVVLREVLARMSG